MKFREKIFIVLLLTNIFALSVMAYINFRESKQSFKNERNRQYQKANQRIKETLEYIVTEDNKTELKPLLSSRIFEFASVYTMEINIYALDGTLIIGDKLNASKSLDKALLSQLFKKHEIESEKILENEENVEQNRYSFIFENDTPIAILHTKNLFNPSSVNQLIQALIKKYVGIVLFLSILSGLVAWRVSSSLTKKIHNVSKKLEKTNVTFLDQPIIYSDNDEIKTLVDAYNKMLVKLEEQTFLLQKNEREDAWKEMAKQVAHEINNPLTPLKLTIQNFQRRFDQEDPNNKEKVKNLVESVVHQIDIISSITKSFSDFAKMPTNQDMEIDVVETIKRTLDIFPPSIVSFTTNVQQLPFKMDMLYLTRIITNLVKNGIQSSSSHQNKKIEVNLIDNTSEFIITIKDNGDGIPDNLKERIFEKNFTTKSTGMGLGLPMVKSIVEEYGGTIHFETQEGVGTTFFLVFSKLI